MSLVPGTEAPVSLEILYYELPCQCYDYGPRLQETHTNSHKKEHPVYRYVFSYYEYNAISC